MSTISLAMIVKNEEAVLARCLQCALPLVDEIIIVDTGSTDRTIEIAKQFTPFVHSFPWIDDFSAARNYAFSFATMDYILWLDADDIITEENQNKFLEYKKALNDEPDIVMMKYQTAFDEAGNPTFSYYRERLMKRSMHFQWEGAIHEAITPGGNIQYSDIAIAHKKIKQGDSDRNLRILETMLLNNKQLSPREQYYYARELYYHKRYQEAIDQFSSFIENENGWIENRIDACRIRGLCYSMLNQNKAALCSLLESFVYDQPRAEILCDIGYIFYRQKHIKSAIYWYLQALQCEKNEESGAFISEDCYNFIPYLQLSVCYNEIKDYENALFYHHKAAAIKPKDPIICKNQAYFRQFEIKNAQ